MTATLSVIIPTFKRTDSLLLLLQRLQQQSGVVQEVIVVDQNPAGYLDGILSSLPEVRHMRLPVGNASAARNQGFLASRGEIILFIDDDLLPENDFCQKGVSLFGEHPEIGCYSPLVYNAEGRDVALQQARVKAIGAVDAGSGVFPISDTISAALFFRRDYFERTGGFDPLLFEFARTAEDQELFLRMRKKGLVLHFVPSIDVYHDETIPGGCDLRTDSYWITREKCMKAWAYRRRIHHHPPGALSAGDLLQLARSGFLNKEVLRSGIGNIRRQAGLLSASIRSSGTFLRDKIDRYPSVEQVNHLSR